MDLCVARLISESSTRQTTKAARVSCLEAVTDLLAKKKTYRTINSLVFPLITTLTPAAAGDGQGTSCFQIRKRKGLYISKP